MISKLDLLLASLTAIHAYHGRRGLRSRRESSDRATAEIEPNTYGLPEGRPIARELRRWFRRQKGAVLAAVPLSGPLPTHLPRLESREWVDPMAAAMVPLLAKYWNEAYRKSQARLSRERTNVVVNPHLRPQIERQSFNFCQSTNQSTARRLEKALEDLKLEFLQGLVEQGDTIPELTRRVRAIFEGLTEQQARRIAATEASRAHHAAQEVAAVESGVVAGKELLVSADACPLCQKVATEAKRVRLGQPFAIIGDHPEYSTVQHPPIHPNCRCTMVDVLFPEYGGPADIEWDLTLLQPQNEIEGDEYKPPRGLKIPEPEPARVEEEVVVVPPPSRSSETITRAVEIAKSRGVPIDVKGYAKLVDFFGKEHADHVQAAYNTATGVILINERNSYWTDPDSSVRKWSEVRWFSTSDPDHIIHHEIGHAEHHRDNPRIFNALKDKAFNEEQKAKIAKDVSRYAAKSPRELVAEMYAGLKSGKIYDASLMRLYEEKLRGPKP